MSKWSNVCDFVNENRSFTRKYMNKVTDGGVTEGQYLNVMLQAKFIKRIGRGEYERLIKIPKSLTSNKMSSIAYSEHGKELMKKLVRSEKLTILKEK